MVSADRGEVVEAGGPRQVLVSTIVGIYTGIYLWVHSHVLLLHELWAKSQNLPLTPLWGQDLALL